VEIKAPNEGQVVVEIKGESISKPVTESTPKASKSCKQSKATSESATGYSKSVPFSCPSLEISRPDPRPAWVQTHYRRGSGQPSG
jgi:hypothetical protein